MPMEIIVKMLVMERIVAMRIVRPHQIRAQLQPKTHRRQYRSAKSEVVPIRLRTQ